jgi:hypothetical protein
METLSNGTSVHQSIKHIKLNKNIFIVVVLSLILFGFTIRLLPHAPNMTPITAIALVGSLYLGRKWALILPCLALFLSDAVIGYYDWKIMLSVYGSFILIGFLSFIVSKYRTLFSVGVSLVSASVLFFLITNGAVWAFSPWYEKTISGLLYSYELGLPFLRNMLTGDVLYTTALIIIFESAYAFSSAVRSLRRFSLPLVNVYHAKQTIRTFYRRVKSAIILPRNNL